MRRGRSDEREDIRLEHEPPPGGKIIDVEDAGPAK